MAYGYAHNRYYRGVTRRVPKVPRGRVPYRQYGKRSATKATLAVMNPRFAGHAGPEFKLHDTPTTAATPSVNGVVFSPLGQIPCGITAEDRVGNRITVKSFQQRGTITIDPLTTSHYVHVRQMVVLDKQANHVTFAPARNILEPGADVMSAPLNNEFFGRFQILKDQVHTLNDTDRRSKCFSFYKTFNMPVNYQSDGTDVPETNNILTFWFSNEPAAGGHYPSINATDRIRFTDN